MEIVSLPDLSSVDLSEVLNDMENSELMSCEKYMWVRYILEGQIPFHDFRRSYLIDDITGVNYDANNSAYNTDGEEWCENNRKFPGWQVYENLRAYFDRWVCEIEDELKWWEKVILRVSLIIYIHDTNDLNNGGCHSQRIIVVKSNKTEKISLPFSILRYGEDVGNTFSRVVKRCIVNVDKAWVQLRASCFNSLKYKQGRLYDIVYELHLCDGDVLLQMTEGLTRRAHSLESNVSDWKKFSVYPIYMSDDCRNSIYKTQPEDFRDGQYQVISKWARDDFQDYYDDDSDYN